METESPPQLLHVPRPTERQHECGHGQLAWEGESRLHPDAARPRKPVITTNKEDPSDLVSSGSKTIPAHTIVKAGSRLLPQKHDSTMRTVDTDASHGVKGKYELPRPGWTTSTIESHIMAHTTNGITCPGKCRPDPGSWIRRGTHHP